MNIITLRILPICFAILFFVSHTAEIRAVNTNSDLSDTAQLLGGLGLEKTNIPENIQKNKFIENFQIRMDQSWKKFNQKLLTPADKWQEENLKEITSDTLFYPFSGPDAVNAVKFFPRVHEIIMLGLEKPGEIPTLKNMTAAEIQNGLTKLEKALSTLIGVNYFFTNSMAEEIGSNSFDGVIAVIMHFLARTGNDVIKVERISLTPDGHEIVLDSAGKPVIQESETNPERKTAQKINGLFKAVKVVFRNKGAENNDLKKIYYFQLDAIDPSLAKTPEFVNFMLQRNEFATMLKASSYLMFSKYFDDMRSLILSRSRFIVQGASGIPYHFFKKSGEWDLKLFGEFIVPTPLFEKRCQPDLAADSKKEQGDLPFNYDYFYPGKKSFLLFAKRKDDWKPSNPKFDKSDKTGIETFCIKGKLMIQTDK
ncbi:MAG: hypothetical protein OEV66_04985 [Spirochaetia bacterium]|nr:hypothetical protein [Spirochaetia bacterium]